MSGRCLIFAYAMLNALAYSLLLPLWEGFDEPFHFAYAQTLANGGGFPDPRSSTLSAEAASAVLLAPASISVKTNLPAVASYDDFFRAPDSERARVHGELLRIDPQLRKQPSPFLNYEAHQPPLAYAILALPEAAMARIPLPYRVLALRVSGAAMGVVLLLAAAGRLTRQLGIPPPFAEAVVFVALSSQMLWATLAHVANDWLAVPLALWLIVLTIEYYNKPAARRIAAAGAVLALGLLAKAYLLAFVPVLAAICVARKRWRDLAVAAAIVAALAGPWYARNVARYSILTAIPEIRQGARPAAALEDLRLKRVPAAIEASARSALWTGNNTFRAFSKATLRILLAVWAAALLLWMAQRHRAAEWIALLYSSAFFAALLYDAAINDAVSHGENVNPAPWYAQPLLVPILSLAFLGAARGRALGKWIASAMVLLSGYVLIATYWAKLIPLYSGFEARATMAALIRLYRQPSQVAHGLAAICFAPPAAILSLALMVCLVAIGEAALLARSIARGAAPTLYRRYFRRLRSERSRYP
ncbi:MAG TPA: hypothetical protein VKX39_14960 [Bryobacteraceae bacterium]|jgi:hypothetical protein|nr:hypothetical protein [Bryobacteraceae bacterium]